MNLFTGKKGALCHPNHEAGHTFFKINRRIGSGNILSALHQYYLPNGVTKKEGH